MKPLVSVVIATRNRARYLDVSLRSLAGQDLAEPFEVIVCDDGSRDGTDEVARRAGVRYLSSERPIGTNAKRNAGIAVAAADLIALVDDDIWAPPDWLRALVEGAARHPGALAFGGPIRARFEGRHPGGCGRESPPITTLDLGPADVEADMVWGANMMMRARALALVGPFDEQLQGGGEEEDWARRLKGAGGSIVYLARAGVDHRRAGGDARLPALMRGAYRRGRELRRYDRRLGKAPSTARELRVLTGCAWHAVRRACPQGLVMGAHSTGRVLETFGRAGGDTEGNPMASTGGALPDPATFSSGESGHVAGLRRIVTRRSADVVLDFAAWMGGTGRRLDRLAARTPQREVLALCIYRPGSTLAARTAAELRGSRHTVRLAFGSTGEPLPGLAAETVATHMSGGKFENLNRLLSQEEQGVGGEQRPGRPDWTIVVDDDVRLPPRFLDRFVALCEYYDLQLTQPAQSLRSHAAWRVTRRRACSLVRETRFVEIGPVTAFSRTAAAELIPFPELRYGWGLELLWGALAQERGWRLGIVDALRVRHEQGAVASSYGHAEAIAETQRFLAEHTYLPASAAQETLVTHRRLRE